MLDLSWIYSVPECFWQDLKAFHITWKVFSPCHIVVCTRALSKTVAQGTCQCVSRTSAALHAYTAVDFILSTWLETCRFRNVLADDCAFFFPRPSGGGLFVDLMSVVPKQNKKVFMSLHLGVQEAGNKIGFWRNMLYVCFSFSLADDSKTNVQDLTRNISLEMSQLAYILKDKYEETPCSYGHHFCRYLLVTAAPWRRVAHLHYHVQDNSILRNH